MPDSAPETETLLEQVGFLRGLARSLVFDEGQAEDVVQDALLVALRDKPRHRSRLRAWLAGITRNLALKSLRSEGRRARREHAVARAESLTGTSEVAARLELHRALVAEVLQLDEPYRSTIVHRYFDDLSVAEIARLMKTPPKTVETRLRRAIQQLRGRLDEAWGGDRRAWSLGLVALVPFTRALPAPAAATAAAGTAATLTGVVMTSKTAALSAVLVVASFFAGWVVKPPETSEADSARADRGGRTVPYDQYRELQGELDVASAEGDLMRRELDEIQREFGKKSKTTAGDGPDGAETRIEGPRFVYGGMVEALNGLDWDVIGDSMSKMPPVLARLSQALAEGKKIEDLADEIGLIQQLNGPLVAEALKMSKSGISGTGLNGIFTHPSVMANMFHAALTKAGMPLTEEQEQLVYEIGLRYTEEDRQRLAGYDEGALGMEKLVGEADLRDRFFAEVYASLTPEQRARIRPEGVKGLTNVDLFSTGVLFGPLKRPLPFRDREDLEARVVARAMGKLELDEASKTVVQDAVRRWADSMPAGYLDVPLPAGGPLAQHSADRMRIAAQSQAKLMRELANRLDLNEEQLRGLQAEVGVIVPYLTVPK